LGAFSTVQRLSGTAAAFSAIPVLLRTAPLLLESPFGGLLLAAALIRLTALVYYISKIVKVAKTAHYFTPFTIKRRPVSPPVA
jgi:hypothetical protein